MPGDPVRPPIPPDKYGMSVNADPRELPPPLRPPFVIVTRKGVSRGGTSQAPLYRATQSALTASGHLIVNPANSRAHAYVQPSREMPRAVYQKAACDTRDDWAETTKDEWERGHGGES